MARRVETFEFSDAVVLVLSADTAEELARMKTNAIEQKGWSAYLDGICPETQQPVAWLKKAALEQGIPRPPTN